MKQFLKYFLASLLATIVSLFLLVLLFFGMVASIMTFSKKEVNTPAEKTVLVIRLDEPILERSSNNPFSGFSFASMDNNSTVGLNEILENIEKASNDTKISGLLLELTSVSGGMAAVEQIRNAILKFKESGKFVFAYSEGMSQGAYYIASAADQVFLQPEGGIELKGLNAQIMFYKNLLEKVGVEMQIIRHGKFKSAIEPYILDKMSEANREQTTKFVGSIWQSVVEQIATSRAITPERVNQIADSMTAFDAKGALRSKLIDGLKYRDEIVDLLKQKVGVSSSDSLNMMEFSDYFTAPDPVKKKTIRSKKVAIIYAQGEIQSGEGSDEIIGSDRIAEAIRIARLDDKVKAIVLRVNSPGGSALASDVIWREVVLAKMAKPVIASMGDVAASGGYYIACAADTIMAMPTTITGSIGVFGMIPNAKKLLNEKIGVSFDEVSTNANSGYGTLVAPMTPYQLAITQKSVEQVYDVFISHVAEGRGMTKAQVDSIGQGRVWSGTDAKQIGLVDLFGNLQDAVKLAASMAKLDEYRVVEYPVQKDPFEEILSSFGKKKAMVDELANQLPVLGDAVKAFNMMKDEDRIQARMPMDIRFY